MNMILNGNTISKNAPATTKQRPSPLSSSTETSPATPPTIRLSFLKYYVDIMLYIHNQKKTTTTTRKSKDKL